MKIGFIGTKKSFLWEGHVVGIVNHGSKLQKQSGLEKPTLTQAPRNFMRRKGRV